MSAIGWGIDCIQFKLSHKPNVAGLNCGEWQYDKRNFTYFTIEFQEFPTVPADYLRHIKLKICNINSWQ